MPPYSGHLQHADAPAAVTPDQVVSLLAGADSIKLKGFGGVSLASPFWIPNIDRYDPLVAQQAAIQTTRSSRHYAGAALALGGLSLATVAFLFGMLHSADSSDQALSWRAKAVTNSGVLIGMGNSDLTIPIGAMLPNGEVLRSVNVSQQSFSTESSETMVKK